VAAGVHGRQANPPSNGPRFVTHKWKGALHFGVRESWTYVDGKFLSVDGPCNAEVGRGSRTVAFRASFPDVVYRKVGRIEILNGESKPYRIQRYRETIDAKSSDPTDGEIVDCGDGSFDPPPVIEQKCDHNYGGRRIRRDASDSRRSSGDDKPRVRAALDGRLLPRVARGRQAGHLRARRGSSCGFRQGDDPSHAALTVPTGSAGEARRLGLASS